MEVLGFDLRAEASLAVLTTGVVSSSAIEGELLNPDEVRSSIARRLGLDFAGLPQASRDVEGIVEMMLDAAENFTARLSELMERDLLLQNPGGGRSTSYRLAEAEHVTN